jgi:hypothetical protein
MICDDDLFVDDVKRECWQWKANLAAKYPQHRKPGKPTGKNTANNLKPKAGSLPTPPMSGSSAVDYLA